MKSKDSKLKSRHPTVAYHDQKHIIIVSVIIRHSSYMHFSHFSFDPHHTLREQFGELLPHSTDDNTEIQRGSMNCPGSYSWLSGAAPLPAPGQGHYPFDQPLALFRDSFLCS